MNRRATIHFGIYCLAWALKISTLAFLSGVAVFAQDALDESWTIRINGQVAQANPDGTFFVPNIPAPDFFGAGGPGTPPDGRADEFVRFYGVSTRGGTNRYAFGEYFQVIRGGTYTITNITFTDIPPRKPESLRVLVGRPTLNAVGQTMQLRVIATYSDGTSDDVTSRLKYTAYNLSNLRFASLSNDGLVTARARGMVFITAVNEGVAAVGQVDVSPGDPLTDVCGFVHDTNGLPVAGLNVKLVGAAGATVSGADGSFRIAGVATAFGIQAVMAYSTNGGAIFGVARNLRVIPGGITDAGIIVVQTLCTTCPDADSEGLPDALELLLGTNPNKRDTDDDGLSDYDEVFLHGTDPLNADTDGDFLSDRDEVITYGTNPFTPDTDRDGWADVDELSEGTDPFDPASHPQIFVRGYPPIEVCLPSAETFGTEDAPVYVAKPPLEVCLPSSETFGTAGGPLLLGRPPVEVCLPGPESFGSAGAPVFVAIPPVEICLPNPETFGTAGAPTFLAQPSMTLDLASPHSINSAFGIFLARPPVSLSWTNVATPSP